MSLLKDTSTEKKDGIFATIIVVLPSQFTGGEAHLSHRGFNTVYDCSATSLNATTVMAWYTDITHEIKPIKSGYRLALSYNLIHTATSLRPAVSNNPTFVEGVTRALDSWLMSTHPEKIIYLLDHQYSLANLRGSALKGLDAALVAYCEDSDCKWYSKRNKGDDYNFEKIESREMTIKDFVDIAGVKISDSLEIDEETETIPEDFSEAIEWGEYHDQEYEGYM